MLRQVCTIEHSFFNTTSGMHHHPIEGRHLVLNYITVINRALKEIRTLTLIKPKYEHYDSCACTKKKKNTFNTHVRKHNIITYICIKDYFVTGRANTVPVPNTVI